MTAAPSPRPLRLAVVLSHPIQYYSPWFQWLAGRAHLHLRVFYLWDFGVTAQRDPGFGTSIRWDRDLLSGYESEFVPNRSRRPGPEHFRGFDNPALPARLAAWRPDAVLLFGYAWQSHLRALLWARLHRVPVLFRGDSHLIDRTGPGAGGALLRRLLFAQCAAFLAVGAANRAFFTRFGVPERRIFHAPHSVDHTLFDPAHPGHQSDAAALRRELQLGPATRVVLFAGKFVPDKQPRELLEAFLALAPGDAALVFVGDGPEKPALLAKAAGAAPGRVHFLPFANQTEMPARHLLADVFALPSRGLYETWGLAVNEAMHLGVPALVSHRVGCQLDLVAPGVTGWVFPADEPGALRAALHQALSDVGTPEIRARFRAAVLARIGEYTFAQTTAGLLSALRSVRPDLARERRSDP
jgi:glycosyltransferase involved in cell wall biosynthesis